MTNIQRMQTSKSVAENAPFLMAKMLDSNTSVSIIGGDGFDRFFRSESHRSRKHGGYGLGLSIVKSIVDAHGGKIEVASELDIGTTFSVYLKLFQS